MINLLVRNLPSDVTDAELQAFFGDLGQVTRVSAPGARVTAPGSEERAPEAEAEARLVDLEGPSASQAVERLQGATLRGRVLEVTEAAPVNGPRDHRAEHALTRERIQAYIWARYVENEAPPFPLDEDQALAFLEAHYRTQPMSEDAECYYFGILAYERSFASPALRRPLLLRALQAFQAYRQQTSADFSWDIIDDRYADLIESLGADADPGAEVAH